MKRRGRAHTISLTVVAAVAWLLVPARVDAQWYFAGSLGTNRTQPSTVTIRQPSIGTSLDIHDVRFLAKPLKSPQYYDWHLGRFLDQGRRFAVELEFIHLKVISDTGRVVHMTGQVEGVPIDEMARMDTRVDQYAMTHGLNFILFNVVSRTPIGASGTGPVSFIARAGAGETIPHAETNVGGQSRQLYAWAGPGAHAAAGVSVRLRGRCSIVAEYKLTLAKPRIPIFEGTGQMTALTHQLAVGLAFGLSR